MSTALWILLRAKVVLLSGVRSVLVKDPALWNILLWYCVMLRWILKASGALHPLALAFQPSPVSRTEADRKLALVMDVGGAWKRENPVLGTISHPSGRVVYTPTFLYCFFVLASALCPFRRCELSSIVWVFSLKKHVSFVARGDMPHL